MAGFPVFFIGNLSYAGRVCDGVSDRRKLIISLLLLMAVPFFLGGCRQERPEPNIKGKTGIVDVAAFKVGLLNEVKSLDPVKIKHLEELQIAGAIYETLFTMEPDTERLVPLLVEQWEVSPDLQSYIIRLRRGIKFHSGRELTAEDVKFSWQRVLAHRQPVELANAFSSIAGANEYVSGRAVQVSGLEVLDPYTLKISLIRPNKYFLQALAHPGSAILDMKVVELVGENYGVPGDYQSPVVVLAGTGPFTIVEWIDDCQVTVKAFDQYHGEAPGINRLEFIQYPDLEMLYADFEAEYLDLAVVSDTPIGENFSPERAISLPGSDIYYLGFNIQKEPFSRIHVREGISYLLDRNSMAERFLGDALMSLMPRSMMEGRPPRSSYMYQPDVGLMILNSEEDLGSLTLTHPEGELWSLIADDVKEQLEKAGLKIRLNSLPDGEFQGAVRRGEVSFFLHHWQSQVPWAEFFLETYFASWGMMNWGDYINPVVDERLTFIYSQADSEGERLDSLLEIEQIVKDDLVILSLWSSERYILFQEDVDSITLLPPGQVRWEKCSRSSG